ncbi:predicted protein [Phaeodactylum tricornutum CCAP 1055/1]|uniref:Uncharacterized protein n=1 Tax=Phaeodactylum tricornutum (strain CCAP 1055/1) TaxID=556484 RepID=B7GC02_PHATC|nr:predicted protein [Phaeodactylum tricornutum CCAP 1055/1]EEC43691.1 predicted protein [Phaeodactylum tricornutum CCAP 1055/1]|eukprot:XP_002184632.1 predicted protein [Phaeodactylum tricornutum CCAP 1055/1]
MVLRTSLSSTMEPTTKTFKSASISPASTPSRGSSSPRRKSSKSLNKPAVIPQTQHSILWCGIARNHTPLARVLVGGKTQDHAKNVIALGRSIVKAEPKSGWDYFHFGNDEQEYGVRGVKFHVYERNAFAPGEKVTLRGLVEETFLNGQKVEVVAYYADQDKYRIRPDASLNAQETLLGDGTVKMTQTSACLFVEKLAVLSEALRGPWREVDRLGAQDMFAAVMQAQAEMYEAVGNEAFHEESLEYSKRVIENNIELLSEGSF